MNQHSDNIMSLHQAPKSAEGQSSITDTLAFGVYYGISVMAGGFQKLNYISNPRSNIQVFDLVVHHIFGRDSPKLHFWLIRQKRNTQNVDVNVIES